MLSLSLVVVVLLLVLSGVVLVVVAELTDFLVATFKVYGTPRVAALVGLAAVVSDCCKMVVKL